MLQYTVYLNVKRCCQRLLWPNETVLMWPEQRHSVVALKQNLTLKTKPELKKETMSLKNLFWKTCIGTDINIGTAVGSTEK